MDLLEFLRGPALVFSLAVFVLGTAWRLAMILRLPRLTDLSPPRAGAPSRGAGAWAAIVRGMWPRRSFGQAAAVTTFNGYVFHIGLALVFFGYAPHIAFVHRITGLWWPALPEPVMALAAGATMLSLLLAMWLRMSDPVLRQISTADDRTSWLLTLLPIVTGMAVAHGSPVGPLEPPLAPVWTAPHALYPGPLALHLLSFELLLIWFPFGKLMHAVLFVFSRGATGARFSHRGVKV